MKQEIKLRIVHSVNVRCDSGHVSFFFHIWSLLTFELNHVLTSAPLTDTSVISIFTSHTLIESKYMYFLQSWRRAYRLSESHHLIICRFVGITLNQFPTGEWCVSNLNLSLKDTICMFFHDYAFLFFIMRFRRSQMFTCSQLYWQLQHFHQSINQPLKV